MARQFYNIPDLKFDNARIIFRNFSGREKKDPKTGKTVNSAGTKNCCIIIDDPAMLQMMLTPGDVKWNIKPLASEDGEDVIYYLPVEFRYDKFPPQIYRESVTGQILLTEETIGNLDYENITHTDILVHPSVWDNNGQPQVKAYASIAHFTVETDPWEQKYSGGAYA